MTKEEMRRLTKEEISWRILEDIKAVIEQILEEEMTEYLELPIMSAQPIGVESARDTIPSTSSPQWARSNNFRSLGTEKGLFSRKSLSATRG